MPQRVERKLMAILAADVAGYSKLMGADEEGTLARLKAHRHRLVDPKITKHRGRIIKTTGDGLLAEFPSAVDAVRCAVEVQRGMIAGNVDVPPKKKFKFRVGINVGDIMLHGGDIFGDGVNVAARLENLAEPGGICVSGRVQEDVRDKLDIAFEDMGEQKLKNIARPVRVYRVRLNEAISRAEPALTLPDKPSIAVLPFQNLSGDPGQEYFADGITEEITTALARLRGFFVIARNSAFTYKGRTVDVKQIGRELGVRYVLEGSVQRAGERVRIGVHLADAGTGREVWVERYERALADLFALQDEIAASVVVTVEPQLTLPRVPACNRRRRTISMRGTTSSARSRSCGDGLGATIRRRSISYRRRCGSTHPMPVRLGSTHGSACGTHMAGARAGSPPYWHRPPNGRALQW